jgi:gliding motility-associated-like protein
LSSFGKEAKLVHTLARPLSNSIHSKTVYPPVKTIMPKTFLASALLFWAAGLAYGQFSFVENKGQWPAEVAARTKLPAGNLWIEKDGFLFSVFEPAVLADLHTKSGADVDKLYHFHNFKISFISGSAGSVKYKSEEIGYHNYYLGDDPAKWTTECGLFRDVRLLDMWPGIDVRIHTDGYKLKYEFHVAPGADPSLIRLGFEGLEGAHLRNGELILPATSGEIREKAPVAWVQGDLARAVKCRFELKNNVLQFSLGKYDPSLPLVIDPELVFSSFVGAASDNWGFTSANDEAGNLIGGGIIFGNNYPTTPGAFQVGLAAGVGNSFDIGVTKFNATGNQLLYSTFLGGTRQEMPHSVICDSEDNIIVLGQTGSTNFPVTAGCFQGTHNGGPNFQYSPFLGTTPTGTDLFLTKFSPAGAMLGSTYVGGSGLDGMNLGLKLLFNYGDEYRGQVAVDANDNIVVASVTHSLNFPVTPGCAFPTFGGGATDGVVFKMNPALSNMIWATYLGGSNDDAAYSVKIDPGGNVLVGGGTKSSNLPVSPNAVQTSFSGDVDGFVFKFNQNGGFLNGTYVGGASYEQVYFCESDMAGNIYVLGQTQSGTFTVSPSCYGNAGGGIFIRKYAPTLGSTLWTTRIGSGGNAINISPSAFLVSNCGQVYFSGWGGFVNNSNSAFLTNSTTAGMPITPDAFQSNTDGSDFYLCVLGLDAQTLDFATFFGATNINEHVDGGSSTFDKNGTVYQSVCAACGGSNGFPTTPGAWSQVNPSTNCNLGVFKFDLGQIIPAISVDGPGYICQGAPAQFINNSTGGTQFVWNFGDGNTSEAYAPSHVYDVPGLYTVTLFVSDDMGCLSPQTTSITIEVIPQLNPEIIQPGPICNGEFVILSASGSPNMFWLDDPTLNTIVPTAAIASPTVTTTYYLVDLNSCFMDTASVTVQVYNPAFTITPDTEICNGQSVQISVNPANNVQWTPGVGLSNANAATTTASPSVTTTYNVTFTSPEGCPMQSSVTISVYEDFPGGNVYPEQTICIGTSVQLQAEPGTAWSWTPSSSLNAATIPNPTASPTQTTTYFVTVTNPCGTGVSQVTVNVIVPQASASPGGSFCFGDSLTLWAEGGMQYAWYPQTYISNPFISNPTVYPPETTTYTVLVTDENGCSVTEQSTVVVFPLPAVSAGNTQAIYWGEDVTINGLGQGTLWWSDHPLIECTTCPSITIMPDESTTLTLNVTDANGCTNLADVFIQVFGPVYVPNAITVTGDGMNDIFFAYGLGVKNFKLQVFNRWGELLWETTDIKKGWNATYNGDVVQQDVYVWRLEYHGRNERKIVYGHVTVLH